MVNYSNGKIYKIVCDTTGLVYIGSTTKQYLSQRLDTHKSTYKCFKTGNRKYGCSSSQVLENDNYCISLLELVNCETKDELHARERHYIETIPCVNKVIPTRTKKEYYEEHKDKLNAYIKSYREANKEEITANSKSYREAHKDELNKKCECECGGSYTHANKSTHSKTKMHIDFVASKDLN